MHRTAADQKEDARARLRAKLRGARQARGAGGGRHGGDEGTRAVAAAERAMFSLAEHSPDSWNAAQSLIRKAASGRSPPSTSDASALVQAALGRAGGVDRPAASAPPGDDDEEEAPPPHDSDVRREAGANPRGMSRDDDEVEEAPPTHDPGTGGEA